MAVRTVYGDGVRTGWIDRGLGMLMAIILLMVGVAVCVYGMLSFRSQAENSAADRSVTAPIVSDFGIADE